MPGVAAVDDEPLGHPVSRPSALRIVDRSRRTEAIVFKLYSH
jgi:hypothetical protein